MKDTGMYGDEKRLRKKIKYDAKKMRGEESLTRVKRQNKKILLGKRGTQRWKERSHPTTLDNY